MKSYQKQILEVEQWEKENNAAIRKLLSYIEEIMGFSISDRKNLKLSPYQILLSLLENMNTVELQNTVFFFLQEFPIHYPTLIYHFINILCQYPYGKQATRLIEQFSKFPEVDNIDLKLHGYQFCTKSGKITVYRVSEHLKSASTLLRTCRRYQITDSHLLNTILAPNFLNDNMVSCLFPELFCGYSYQSYIELTKEKGWLDLVHQTFYPDDSFEKFFEPKILVKEKGRKFIVPPLLQEAYEKRKKNK